MAQATSINTTRRRFLVTAAGASALSAGTLAAAALDKTTAFSLASEAGIPTTVDPIFAAIEAHRQTHVAHMAALTRQSQLEVSDFDRNHDDVVEQTCVAEDDAFEAFVAEPATTMPGLLAKLAYFEELASERDTEWLVHDCVECADLINSFVASLKNIGVLA
jgi:hypothetical protein